MKYCFTFFFCSLFTVATAQICDSLTIIHYGEATYYGGVAGGSGGNCGLPVPIEDTLHCAMNHTDYDSANACGAFVHVWGPKGDVVLKVVDRCPECKPGDIDMTQEAFGTIADVIDGRVDITWQYVACTQENIKIHYKTGSSIYWTGVQFRDHKYPILKFEYLNDNDEFVTLNREMFNFWIEENGFYDNKALDPIYSFRITDYNQQTLTIENVDFAADTVIDLGIQFPDVNCDDCHGDFDGTASIDNCGVCSGGNTGITVNDCTTTSIEASSSGKVLFWPNPAFNSITLKEVLHYSISTVRGQVLIQDKGDLINIEHLSTGLYFLHINQQCYRFLKM